MHKEFCRVSRNSYIKKRQEPLPPDVFIDVFIDAFIDAFIDVFIDVFIDAFIDVFIDALQRFLFPVLFQTGLHSDKLPVLQAFSEAPRPLPGYPLRLPPRKRKPAPKL